MMRPNFTVYSLLSILSDIYCQNIKQGTMRAAQFSAGGPELLTIGQAPIPDPRSNEVLIQVYATAINRADTLQRKGAYPPPKGESDILGLEAAGIVHTLGNGTSKWKKGDRVMALLPGGGNAEYVTAPEDHLLPVPKDMSFTTAASIPEVWLTAYQLLHLVGGLKSGETVLIHAGGSGVGTAAVQLAKLAGANPIVTAGSQHKIDTAKRLGAVEGFNYKENDFGENVLEYTKGTGVNLILDCVGASFWKQNVAAMAVDGRWVLYGLLGGFKVEGDLLASVLRKRIHLLGSTLRTRSKDYKAELVKSFYENALPHFANGTLKTVIDSVMPLEDLSKAHQKMESNQNTGKIVIEVLKESGIHPEL